MRPLITIKIKILTTTLALAMVVALVMALAGCAPAGGGSNEASVATAETPSEDVTPDDGTHTSVLEHVVRLTNTNRLKHGLSALHADLKLQRAAELHAADMVARGYFAHTNLDGKNPRDRTKAAGKDSDFIAENIAMGQTTVSEVMRDWMNSPGHRANILNPELHHIGVGFADGHWVQDFSD